jgi:type VI secretion system protein ImpI
MQLLLTLRNADTFGVTEAQRRVSGSLSIGRGKQAGWPLPDPTRMLSAVHCEIKQEKRGFTLTDFSRNGTRLNGEPVAKMEPIVISNGDQIELGPYLIAVGKNDGWGDHTAERTVISKRAITETQGDKTVITTSRFPQTGAAADTIAPSAPKKAKQPAVPRPTASHAPSKDVSRRFVDAFCEGAALDPDSLAGRSDLEFATELGAVMRNLVGGMSEISNTILEMRTVIGSSEKGPTTHVEHDKPSLSTAQKRKQTDRLLALYFGNLQSEDTNADTAFGVAIDDASRHNKALFFAMQTALFRLLNELSPTTIERETRTGIIRTKSAMNWNAYLHKWESLNTDGEDGMLDVFLRYFSEAYDSKMQSL